MRWCPGVALAPRVRDRSPAFSVAAAPRQALGVLPSPVSDLRQLPRATRSCCSPAPAFDPLGLAPLISSQKITLSI